jgi:hypothetical protein
MASDLENFDKIDKTENFTTETAWLRKFKWKIFQILELYNNKFKFLF